MRIRRETYPSREQWVGILIGTLLMAILVASAVSPRIYAGTAVVLLLAIVLVGSVRLRRAGNAAPTTVAAGMVPGLGWLPRPAAAAAGIIGLCGFAVLSALWSPWPSEGLAKSTVGFGLALLTAVAATAIAAEPRRHLVRVNEGLWLGCLIAIVLLAIEVRSGQALRIAVLNGWGATPQDFDTPRNFVWRDGRIVAANRAELTRMAAPVALLVWPGLLAAWSGLVGPWRLVVTGMMALAAIVMVLGSGSKSAKFALAVGAIVAVAMARWPRGTGKALMVTFVVAALLVVPFAYSFKMLDAQKWPVIVNLFRGGAPAAQVSLWHAYAVRVLEAPVVGHGADMTYSINAHLRRDNDKNPNLVARWMRPHTHNVYLQVWYELGAVGAVLLALAGVVLLRPIRAAPPASRPLLAAAFAATATLLATSYGLWQPWIMGLLTVFALAVVIAAHAARPDTTPPPPVPLADTVPSS